MQSRATGSDVLVVRKARCGSGNVHVQRWRRNQGLEWSAVLPLAQLHQDDMYDDRHMHVRALNNTSDASSE